MECLIYFGMTSMKEGTSAQLSGRGELHGGARVTTLVTLRKCPLGHKRVIKTLKFVSASTKGFKGGLAWIKPSKKDMADRAQRSRVGANRNGMGGHAPHGQHDASDARFVAYPGKAARHLPREGVRRQQARGETCCPATR